MTVDELNEELWAAMKASEYADKRPVFGLGSPNAKIALVGEAPGHEEEKLGEPFVGKAGKNLTEFLKAVGLTRDELYITNAVKLRPSKPSPKTGRALNRTPNAREIEFFNPYLHRELEIISAKYIVTLGNVPLRAVTGQDLKIGDCHGRLLSAGVYKNVFALYHPAAVIYNQSLKEVYLRDLEALCDEIRSV
ncbi:MAG: uracil-DNA glycosylase [Defluviitaleaceae bacterium]|nr:uracil-DNA glycosylase [Defluviitaleaceae bacterium]